MEKLRKCLLQSHITCDSINIVQRTHVYLPDELSRQIDNAAKTQRKSKSEIIREALEKGIKAVRGQKSQSGRALLDLARLAKNLKGTGPKDLSTNHDYYIWGGEKRTEK